MTDMTDLTPDEERRLRGAIAALPESVEPEEDLWPAIRARIDATRVVAMPGSAARTQDAPVRRTLALSWTQLATAASLLVVATAMLTWIATREDPASGTEGPSVATVGVDTPSLAIFASYENTAAELSAALERRSELLDPKTREVLARSLRTIDAAIEEARAALAADPASPSMRTFVEAAYRQKVDFLRRANDVAALRGT